MPERCDYAQIRAEFSNMLGADRRCIISGDIDGIFSAVLATQVFQWQVVGLYTLNDLWILKECLPPETADPQPAIEKASVVFLDHDIYRSNLDSIGHHMLQWSGDTPIPLHSAGRASLNPNLLRGFTKKEFNRKYPFGTFHFLLACSSAWGILGDFDPDDETTTLLLHIDSSFESGIKYQDNVLDWLEWLGGSERGSPLYPICRRMRRFSPYVVLAEFRKLADRFRGMGIKPRSQAPLDNPEDPDEIRAIQSLVKWFTDKTEWQSRFPVFEGGELRHFKMDRHSTKPTKGNFQTVVDAEPFSYAIIGGDDKGLNYNWFEGHTPPTMPV